MIDQVGLIYLEIGFNGEFQLLNKVNESGRPEENTPTITTTKGRSLVALFWGRAN